MLLASLLTYHLAYQSGAIAVRVAYQAVSDRYGYVTGITAGKVTIDDGARHFVVDLSSLVPIGLQHISLASPNGGCGATQPLDIVSNYVVVETIWNGKGCRPAAYFIDTDSAAIVETVDLDHRWAHRLDIQSARFDGKPVRVERVDHVALAFEVWDGTRLRTVPGGWKFVIVDGRDSSDVSRLYAYEATTPYPRSKIDPGWNIFPTPGSVVEVGPLKGLSWSSYHPNPDVLRMDAADDARYSDRQAPTSLRDAHMIQRNQWFLVVDEDVQALQFMQALRALAKMVSLDNSVDPATRATDQAMYDQCRAMVAQFQAGKISAASARTRWQLNGCRP